MILWLAAHAHAADPDAAACKEARRTGDVPAWTGYLDMYPLGTCADEARRALAKAGAFLLQSTGAPTDPDGLRSTPTPSITAGDAAGVEVSILELRVDGPQDDSDVLAVLNTEHDAFVACFDHEQARRPDLGSGRIDTSLLVAPEGTVTRVDFVGGIPSPGLRICVRDQLLKAKLPEAPIASLVHATVDFQAFP
jgi:hypothetical protein